LHALWSPPAAAKQPASEEQQQQDEMQGDACGGDAAQEQEESKEDAAGSTQPRQIKPVQQPSLKSSTRHKAATQRILNYLITLQASHDCEFNTQTRAPISPSGNVSLT
jgi:hypothetical protein